MGIVKKFQKVLLSPYELFLVSQARLGDREAFGKLYQLYLDKIYRFVYFRVGQQKEEAEDLVAEIFLKAWERMEQFKDGSPNGRQGSFQAWLYMIARNHIIDYYRLAKQQVVLQEETAVIEDSDILLGLEVERVKDAMKQLTTEQQELLTLKFIEDLSNKEIAVILGKREDAIRAMQYRAIKELKEILI